VLMRVVGSSYTQSNPRDFGAASDGLTKKIYETNDSKAFGEKRNELRAEAQKEAEGLGYSQPIETPTDQQVTLSYLAEFGQATAVLDLGELEKIVNEKAKAKLDFKVPEVLKKYSAMGLQLQSRNGELSKEESDAFQMYQALVEAYKIGSALQQTDSGAYFAGVNQMGSRIAENYKPAEAEQTREAA